MKKGKSASSPAGARKASEKRKPAAAASKKRTAKSTTTSGKRRMSGERRKADGVVLLSGGNPQIAKAEGDAPVQAYIAAMPEWKRELGERLDRLIVRNVPKVRKAVKWNSPFYGVEGKGWFLSFHVFARYVKVTFFNGTSLRPLPPGGTDRSGETRWIDLREGEFDETQLADWIRQSAAIPGWTT